MSRFFLVYLGLFPFMVLGQDDEFIQKALRAEEQKNLPAPPIPADFISKTLNYKLDLNEDKEKEQLEYYKADGIDVLEIKDHRGQKLYGLSLNPKGPDSRIYRVQLLGLSEKKGLLVLYYDEGSASYLALQENARLVLLTFEKNNLGTIKSWEGPVFFDEAKIYSEHYHQRAYTVRFEDLNHDGTKDLILAFKKIRYVYLYQEGGEWKKF